MNCTTDNDLDILDFAPQEIQLPKLSDVVFERDLFKVNIYIFLTN